MEQYLARGAMGTVYRVFDESTGRRVALKRHAPVQALGSTRRKGATATRQSVANFEREYNTLARLRHPSIIDVYDYGRDAGGPYYTMELLDGQDVRELAPLSPQQACRLLRDIASSLALLHAHRLVHRDVSPRNVRRTAAGRCKLMDFGALAAFGIAPDVVGTPSCVPPEALHGLPLDQRADLYSLGCLAYFLLTGRHAYPARRFDELGRAWSDKPPSPSTLSPNVPRALDELVRSLLSLDPLARPATAAEVIDRLSGIANLEPEERHVAARSYLSSSKTVGRSVEIERLGRRLRDTPRVAGGAVLIEGEAGIGKTRLLRELLLEAQLAGATALQVDAADGAEPNAIVRLLGTRLLQANPEAALEAARPHARYLSHALPVARGRLGRQPAPSIPDAPGEWRARLQSAFKAWLLEYTGTLPLVVGIDNFDQLDEASAGLLAALVSEASGRELLLVFTARPSSDGEALRAVREAAEVIPLSGLNLEALAELVESLFGDVPNAARLSRWLLRLSGGNPLQCMELVRHLLHEGIIRYAEGTWVLPQDLSSDGLPHSIDEALTSRLARLSAPARALADGLSLARGPLDIEQILRLAELMLGQTRPVSLASLDALLREGVLAGSAAAFRFSHEPLQALVARSLDDTRKGELHRQLSRVLLADNSPFAALEAGWHLLVAGDEELAAELLARAGLRVLEETDDLHAAVPALEAALDVYRRRGRPPQELVPLITPLATAAFFVDRHLSTRYGPETIAVLRSATGLALAERLQPLIGPRFAVYAGLAVAWFRYKLADRSRRPPSFRAMIVMLLRCATTLAGVASACLDGDGVRRILRVIEPLTVLGREHPASLIVDYCKSLEAVSSGQFGAARDKLLRLLAILERPADDRTFPDYVRRLFVGGALYALGAVESMRDGPDVLRYADRLGKLELRLYDMVADQLRMLYHAHRGEMRLADVYRKRVETYAMERGSAWQVEVWEPPAMVIVHAREGNLVALRRCTEQLDRLSAEIPSLSRYAALARASYLRLRGRIDEAIALFEGLLAGPDGDRYIGWAPAVGSLASLYNAAGQHARARQVTESLLDTLSPADRPFVRLTLFAQIEHALAVAGLGDLDAAAAELDSLLAEHEPNQGPVTLGCLHEARARVGIEQRDRAAFAHHWARMEHWFRRTENPALIGACERLAAEGVRTGTISAPAEALPSDPGPRRGVATLRRLRRD